MSQLVENVSLKLYSDKITLTQFHDIKKKWGYFNEEFKVDLSTGELCNWTYEDHNRYAYNQRISRVRAINHIFDISDRNLFKYFLTITLNEKYVDRSDPVAVHAAYKRIMKRLKYRFKGLAYLSVPEFHADKINMHYHIMINFKRKPKLQFQRDLWYKRGIKCYTFQDKFYKDDCFLILEKLDKNNPFYLVKYMTKSMDKPLPRRYSCSRNLNRCRVQSALRFSCKDWDALAGIVEKKGFTAYSIEDGFRPSCFVFDNGPTARPRGSAAGAADLSNKYIKGENLIDVQLIFKDILEEFENIRKVVDRLPAINAAKRTILQKGEQLALDF